MLDSSLEGSSEERSRMAGAAASLQTAVGAGVDRAVMQFMELAWTAANARAPSPDGPAAKPGSLGDPMRADVVHPHAFPEPEPAPLEFVKSWRIWGGRAYRCRWPSSYRTADPDFQAEYDRHRANRTAHVEWFQHRRPAAATVICLHAWMAGSPSVQRRAFRWLYDAGLDILLFTLPFHGPRTPSEARFGGQLFPGRCLRRTNEGFGQIVWDVRALRARLERDLGGAIGVAGMSIGGYATALLASVEPRLQFAIPIVPVVDVAALMWRHGARRPERLRQETGGRSLEEMRAAYAMHSPLARAPLVPRHRRLIVVGRGDRVCTPEHVSALWDHWQRPAVHWLPGGHVAQFGRGAAGRHLHEFIQTATGPDPGPHSP